MEMLVGIDIGGTNTVCGLVTREGRLVAKLKQTTEAQLGSEHVMNKIAAMIKQLLSEAGMSLQSVAAAGVGTPGHVDPEQGIVIFAGNLNWRQVPIAAELGKKLGVPVFVDNDVRMYVYGEAMNGAAKGYDHVLGITLGTGLAAGMINKGRLYYGGQFMAGEIGHIHIGDTPPYLCGCGMTGCLETVVSATGIARQARDLIRSGKESVLQQWYAPERMEDMTAHDVSKAYDSGDEVAAEVFNNTGGLLGKALSYAVTLLSPDIIVIGGGAAMAGEKLFKPMREQLQRFVFPGYWEKLTIATGLHLDEAGVIGSALFASRRAESDIRRHE